MSLVVPWNCEKFSLHEILSFLEKKGYHFSIKYHDYDGGIHDIFVEGTDLIIDGPVVDKAVDQIFSAIHFNDYPKTDKYEESKKVYIELRRKFGKKKTDTKTKFIKDEHLNKEIYKRLPKVGDGVGTKKGWKFWK